jgi:hypothetical protein
MARRCLLLTVEMQFQCGSRRALRRLIRSRARGGVASTSLGKPGTVTQPAVTVVTRQEGCRDFWPFAGTFGPFPCGRRWQTLNGPGL